jgi:U3 small nucleolar RNA-associated protein 4
MIPCPPTAKKTNSDITSINFTICLRYSEILFQDFVAENEMIIVEEPWMSILEDLPDALARRVYGT